MAEKVMFRNFASPKDEFHLVATRFLRLGPASAESEKINVNLVLDQLKATHLESGSASEEDLLRVIGHCSRVVKPNQKQLTVKACSLLTYILSDSEVALSEELLASTIVFLLECINQSEEWALADILRTTGAVLYGRGGLLQLQRLDDLITPESGILHKLIFGNRTDSSVRIAALQCVENITISLSQSRGNEPYIDDYYANQALVIFMTVLKTKLPKVDENAQCKLLCTALRGIQNITANTKTAHGSVLGEMLAALKAYNFYGKDDPSLKIPSVLEPTNIASDVPIDLVKPTPPCRPQKRGGKKKSKPRRRKQDGDGEDGEAENSFSGADMLPSWRLSGSDSEFSDTEGASGVNRLQAYQSRVRQNSLAALYSVVKSTDKRIVFGYWTSFIPTSADEKPGTLAAVISQETSSKVRIAALVALTAFLEKSKTALLMASESEMVSASPFTPFSVLLGNMVKEVHKCLLDQLKVESSFIVISQLIKCLSVLVANTPYHKLQAGLITRLCQLVRPYLSHRDSNTRVAALTCMGAVVTVHAPLLEVSHLLQPLRDDDGTASNHSASEDTAGSVHSLPSTPPPLDQPSTPPKLMTSKHGGHRDSQTVLWLVQTCARCIHSRSPGITIQLPVRLEALQVLSGLVTGYLNLVETSMDAITAIIVQAMADSDPSVRLHGAKTASSCAASISRHFMNNPDDSTFPLATALTFWDRLLSGPLIEALQNPTHQACECLADIGDTVFSNLSVDKRIMCMTMMLGIASDPDPLVRGSAARALGVFVLFTSVRDDLTFVADAANAIITCMEDENLGVRVKAAWAMANVTDALVLNLSLEDFESFAASFSDMLLLKLYQVSMNACLDSDKIKYNGTRGLGNLLRYTQPVTLERRNISDTIEKAVKMLVQCLNQGTMKARWNACYALGNLLQSDHLTTQNSSWLEHVFGGLCLVMKNCKSFKVRINSASALATPQKREKFGSTQVYCDIWRNTIEAMSQSQQVDDFADYKYIASLSAQLCKLLLHLACLVTVEDLTSLGAVLFSKEDTVKQFLLNNNQQSTQGITEHLSRLLSGDLTSGQRNVISTLASVIEPTQAEPSKSAFRETYD